MKKIAIYTLLLATATFAQFPGPPAAYPRIASDTISDTALVLWQIPRYGGSNTTKLRSMTWVELATGVANTVDSLAGGCTNSGFTGTGPCVRKNNPVLGGAVGVGGTPNTYPYVDGWSALEVITNGSDSLHLFSVTGYNRAPTRHDNYARIVAGDTLYGLQDELISSYGIRAWDDLNVGDNKGFGGSSYAELAYLDESSNGLIYPKTHKVWSFGNGSGRTDLLYGNYSGLGVGSGFSRTSPPLKTLDVHGSILTNVHVYLDRADTNAGNAAIYSTATTNNWTAGQGVGCGNGTAYCIYGYGAGRVAMTLQKADNQARFYNNLTVGNPSGSGSLILSRATTSDGNTVYSVTNGTFNWGLGPDGNENYLLHSYLGGGDVLSVNKTTGKATFIDTIVAAGVRAPSVDISGSAGTGAGTPTFGTASPCASSAVTYIPFKFNGQSGYIPWCKP